MNDPVRLDMVSLRCLVASQLATALAQSRSASSAEDVVEAYFEVLEEIRD